MPKKLTKEEFITRSQEVHGDKYDYSLVEYKNNSTKVWLICPIHGKFKIRPGNHLTGQGCKTCGYERNGDGSRLTLEEFLARSVEAHGNKYDYSKVEYSTVDNQVTIICPVHGEFQQIAKHHMNGIGCKRCGVESAQQKTRMTLEEFVTKARGIHGDKYGYENAIYQGSMVPLLITCLIHGDFPQIPNDHLSKKAGCPSCAGVKRYTTPQFTELAKEVHEGKYTYENVVYATTDDKVLITCPKHGDFPQTPHDHLQGVGCPSCGCNGISKGETELVEFVKSLGVIVDTRDRSIIKPYELDIVLPELKVAIEYNGLYYHSEKFERTATHKHKTDAARESGYRLIHIYEDDWRDRRPIVERTIKNILGLSTESIFARNLTVVVKSYQDCKDFYEDNHLQGEGRGDSWCLMQGEKIVAAMQFSQSSSERGNTDVTRWELVRYASAIRVTGGASRLFTAFVRDNPQVATVVSYSDNDMFDGGMYEKLGFVKDSDVRPDYKYVVGNKRIHKSNFKKSNIAKFHPEVYDENLSEREMCEKLGYYRIYNSGLTKWAWKRP